MSRTGRVERETSESRVLVELDLDGSGETSIDGGELVFQKGVRVALHDQRPPRDQDITLRDYVLSACKEQLALEEELGRLEIAMAEGERRRALGRRDQVEITGEPRALRAPGEQRQLAIRLVEPEVVRRDLVLQERQHRRVHAGGLFETGRAPVEQRGGGEWAIGPRFLEQRLQEAARRLRARTTSARSGPRPRAP